MNGGELTGGHVTNMGGLDVNANAVISSDIIMGGASNSIDNGTLTLTAGSVQPGTAISGSGVLRVASGGSHYAHGTIGTGLTIDANGRLMLSHMETLTLSKGATNCGRIVLSGSTLAGGTIRIGSTGSIRGYGRIQTPLTFDGSACGTGGGLAPLAAVNQTQSAPGSGGIIAADEPGRVLELASPIAGIAELRAETGTLRMGTAAIESRPKLSILDTGSAECVPGLPVIELGDIANHGLLTIAGTNIRLTRYTGAGGINVSAASTVAVDEDFLSSATDATWSWEPGAHLVMAGGQGEPSGPSGTGAWARLEAAARDAGAQGDAAFKLAELALADGAHVALVDLYDNGHRQGLSEALYVESLTLGQGSVLNLNSLHLYVGNQGPIGPGQYGGGQIVDQPVTPRASADLDGDGDVDMTDFLGFQACFNGPNQAPAKAGCANTDFDTDGDVDLMDFGTFQACFNGRNRPPACP